MQLCNCAISSVELVDDATQQMTKALVTPRGGSSEDVHAESTWGQGSATGQPYIPNDGMHDQQKVSQQ
jgi:hypothetical protein